MTSVEFYKIPADLRAKSASDAALIEALRQEITGQMNGEGAKPVDLIAAIEINNGRLIIRGNALLHRSLARRLAGG